jgi:two-component system sensor histidine kinase DegS
MSEDNSTSKNIIYSSNKEMLDYFNNLFLKDLENIQAVKTQIFEIDIHIDELQKTKNIYAFKSSSRRSVFTPVAPEALLEDESLYIQDQIKELEDSKLELESNLRSLERSLNNTKKKINNLQAARDAIARAGLTDEADLHSSVVPTDDDGFQFIESEKDSSENIHNYNVLMQEAFDSSYISTMLKKSVIEKLSDINHKLDLLSSVSVTDPNRVKITAEDIKRENESIDISVKDIIGRLDFAGDTGRPIWLILDEFVKHMRDRKPEITIDASVECPDYNLKLHPVFTINLVKLLNIFFDNVFKHANATKIIFKLYLTPNIVEITISDNGIGINPDYMEKSPWYSSLHKAFEIIYMLGGQLSINGAPSKGTNVRFNFPVKV